MDAIERENRSLKGVLPKDYARPALDKQRLGELIDLIGNIGFGDGRRRQGHARPRLRVLPRPVRLEEGKKGGEFYTPRSVVKLLVEMIEPYQGRVYDPCCGSSGMFVQSEEFIAAHGGRLGDISIFGQESNPTTWQLAKMNLAIRGIEANLGPQHADTFRRDLHPDLKADFVLANPPFNMSDWGARALRRRPLAVRRAAAGERELRLGAAHDPPPRAAGDRRLRARERLDELAAVRRGRDPQGDGRGRSRRLHGRAARAALLRLADPRLPLVPRPRQVGRATRGAKALRDRRGETLFIDARKLGRMVSRDAPRADRRGARAHRRHLPRLARRARRRRRTRTSPASARARRSRRSASTATC